MRARMGDVAAARRRRSVGGRSEEGVLVAARANRARTHAMKMRRRLLVVVALARARAVAAAARPLVNILRPSGLLPAALLPTARLPGATPARLSSDSSTSMHAVGGGSQRSSRGHR